MENDVVSARGEVKQYYFPLPNETKIIHLD
jgi:hypothetical protein